MRFDSECDCAPPVILLRPLLAHECRVSFFGGLQHSSVGVCPALSRDFGVLAEEDEHTSSTPLFFLFDKENVKIQFCVPTTSYPLVSTKFLHKYVPGTYFLSLHYYGGFVLCHICYAGNTFPIVLFSAYSDLVLATRDILCDISKVKMKKQLFFFFPFNAVKVNGTVIPCTYCH